MYLISYPEQLIFSILKDPPKRYLVSKTMLVFFSIFEKPVTKMLLRLHEFYCSVTYRSSKGFISYFPHFTSYLPFSKKAMQKINSLSTFARDQTFYKKLREFIKTKLTSSNLSRVIKLFILKRLHQRYKKHKSIKVVTKKHKSVNFFQNLNSIEPRSTRSTWVILYFLNIYV